MSSKKMPSLQKFTLVLVTAFLAFVFIIPSVSIQNVFDKGEDDVAQIGDPANKDARKLTLTNLRQESMLVEQVYISELPLSQFADRIWYMRYSPSVESSDRLYNHATLAYLARKSGIHVSSEKMKSHMAELIKKGGGYEALKKRLNKTGISEEAFIATVRESLMIDQLLSFVFEHEMKTNYQSAVEALKKVGRRFSFRMVRIERAQLSSQLAEAKIEAAYNDFYQNNKNLFETPEQAFFEVVSLVHATQRQEIEQSITNEDLERYLEKKENRQKIGKGIEDKRSGARTSERRPWNKPDKVRVPGARRQVKPWPPEDEPKKPDDKKAAKKPDDKQVPIKLDGGKKQWSAKQLLAEYKEQVREAVVEERIARRSKSAWDQLALALTKDPGQSLKRLAKRLGLTYQRSDGYRTREKLGDWTRQLGAELPSKVFELALGQTSKLISPAPGLSYRVRTADRHARRKRSYKSLTRDEILAALLKKHQSRFRTEAVYEFDRVGLSYARWTRPLPSSTETLRAFYDEHKKLLFKDQKFEAVRDRVEHLLSRGTRHEYLSEIVKALHEKASRKKASPPPPRGQRPPSPPAPQQDLLAQGKIALDQLADSRGLEYKRYKLTAGQLGRHPAFEGQLSEANLEGKDSGWLSDVLSGSENQFFVRLITTTAARDKTFDEARADLQQLILESAMKALLESHAKEVLDYLRDKGFSEGAAKYGLKILAFQDIKSAAGLKRLSKDERGKVFSTVEGVGTVKKISEVNFSDTERTAAYIVQLTAERFPSKEELHSFAIKQRAREQVSEVYSSRMQNLWYNPKWYGQSGYPGYKPLAAPKKKSKRRSGRRDGGAP